jgi:hypothetical protein
MNLDRWSKEQKIFHRAMGKARLTEADMSSGFSKATMRSLCLSFTSLSTFFELTTLIFSLIFLKWFKVSNRSKLSIKKKKSAEKDYVTFHCESNNASSDTKSTFRGSTDQNP